MQKVKPLPSVFPKTYSYLLIPLERFYSLHGTRPHFDRICGFAIYPCLPVNLLNYSKEKLRSQSSAMEFQEHCNMHITKSISLMEKLFIDSKRYSAAWIQNFQKLRNVLFSHKVVKRAASFTQTKIVKLQITKTKIFRIANQRIKTELFPYFLKSSNLLFRKVNTVNNMKSMSL